MTNTNEFQQKRVLAVHDISCVGKCSLTVALPIISAAGVECSVLPTAVLSTHTGGFRDFTFRDLTEDIRPIIVHWKSLGIHFDAIYTGYLGSFEQIDIVSALFDEFASEDTTIIVDPVMGDNGTLYAAFDDTFPPEMKKLCGKADVILPNLTEATAMLGEKYKDGPYTKNYIEKIFRRLEEATNTKKIVLTGVNLDNEKMGAATYDAETGNIDYILGENIPGRYHGTGDVFGSAVVGALANGMSLADSVRAAVDFTVESIRWTAKAGTDIRYGVNFEANLAGYIKSVQG
ncbi:pyridoxamine kinase [Schwartzia succinivorans]|jgi:pyridoxine kinase|uniref:pyridoxal kinase n=1 Tax=Schwartzia succinivorans DSM 10502 TaxID=1123243 RepID=A0A1M4X9P1_9FIRM|nr:pyridoxamine kinase [Schwartzia succinivorans]MBQ1917732.1 pyridoxamine kinase [Schwartzia sp. (in: firmicutes)]MBQ3863198.1 pyridoxamine kinase [Schwartzia sp. (in: firmicutes)]MBQ5414447.1 pyridoxamine kinase [Schwartzia sp. (in: firmicutes)]SHE90131.1 pyridoxine kinase [Schwartzia succinivorans DSM 10502]